MNEDKDIEQALTNLTADQEPSDELMRKLRFAARITKPARIPWWQSKLSMGVAFAAIAAVTVMTLIPAQASAKTFEKLVSAVDRTNAFQFSIVSNEKNKTENISFAGQDGRVYMQLGDGGVLQFEGGAMSIYDAKSNTITRMKFGNSSDVEKIASQVQNGIAEGMKEWDLKKMLKEYSDKYGRDSIRISSIRWENGRNVYYVDLASKTEPDRVHLRVDAGSDLPDRMEVETNDGNGNWRRSVTMEMKFGNNVDPNALHVSFPKNAKVEEINLENLLSDAFKEIGKSIKP